MDDKITKLAEEFKTATDDIELKSMNDHIQAYLLNMLGIDCGRYWVITPLAKSASIKYARKPDETIEVTLYGFSNQIKTKWDARGRDNTLANGIRKIVESELKHSFPYHKFDVKVSLDSPKRW